MTSPLNTTNPPDDTGHPPVLDPSVLDALLAELEQDESALDSFVDAFLRHLPERLRRAEAGVRAEDSAAIRDCALSIRVSSEMVGALWLSRCGGELASIAQSGRLERAATVLGMLRAVGDDTRRALAAARNREPAP